MPREMPTTWPEWEYQISTGSYGGLDDRVKRRGRKQPIGFAPPQPKRQPSNRKGKR